MSKVMNRAIYTRVSTDTQAEKEFSSCEAQEEKIRAFVKSQSNWKVFKVYSDAGYTGANLNRPALQELLEDIKQGEIDIVLVSCSSVPKKDWGMVVSHHLGIRQ
ncbi:MAG TPA: recombinase family protein [Candidatus Atribacteria bacterium]|nr:recombinase family protein [Candidatus Atribacteria bacterium]